MAKTKNRAPSPQPTRAAAVAADVRAVPEAAAFGSARDAADAAAHAASAMAEAERREQAPAAEAAAEGRVPAEDTEHGGLKALKAEPGAAPDDDTAAVDGHDAILEAARMWRVF